MKMKLLTLLFCALICSSLVAAALPDFTMDRNITFTNVSEGVKNASYVCFKDGTCFSTIVVDTNDSAAVAALQTRSSNLESANVTTRAMLSQVNTSSNILFHAYASGINKTTELFTYFSGLFLGISDQRYNDTTLINTVNTTTDVAWRANATDQLTLITILYTNASGQQNTINFLVAENASLWTNASQQAALLGALFYANTTLTQNDTAQLALIQALQGNITVLLTNVSSLVANDSAQAVLIGTLGSSLSSLSSNAAGWTNTSTATTTTLNVGIGTTAPTQKLDVNGSVAVPYGNITLGNSSTSNPYLNFIKGNGFSGGIQFLLEDGTTIRGYVYMDDLEDLRLKGDDVVIEATDNVIIKPRTSNSDVLRLWNNASTSVHEFSITSSNSPFYDMNNAAGTNTVRIHSATTSYFNGGGVSFGTTSSTGKVDVNGTVNVSGPTNPNVMIVDSTNGRLGVNIVPPGQFAVGWPQGNASGSGATRFDMYGGTSNYRMQIDNNSYLMSIDMFPIGNNATSIRYWRNVNTTGAAYIDLLKADGTANSAIRLRSNGNSWLDGGNVGVGTQSPTQKLDVNGSVNVSGNAFVDKINIDVVSGADNDIFNIADYDTSFSASNVQYSLSHRSSGRSLWLFGYDGTTFKTFLEADYGNSIIRMPGNVNTGLTVSTSTGNVGIGTGAPTRKLDVNGTSMFRGDVGIISQVGSANASTQTFSFANSSANTLITASDGGTGDSLYDIDAQPTTTSRASIIRLFRRVNTTSTGTGLVIQSADGTSGVSGFLSPRGSSYLGTGTLGAGAKLGIGTTTPTQKLDVNGSVNVSTEIYIGTARVCRSDGTNCPASGSGGFIGDQGVNRTSNVTFNSLNISSPGDPILLLNGSGYCWRIEMESTQLKIVDCDGSVIGTFNKDSDTATFTNLGGTSSYSGAVSITGTAAAGQTASILELKNSSGSILVRVEPAGALNASKGLRSNITGCDSIDTLADGTFVCGTDAGAGSGDGTGGWTNTSTTTSATVNVSISQGNEYQINGAGIITRTGTNAVVLGNTSGNARGTNAIDVQQRTQDTEVCSGTSSICFGYRNTNNGTQGVAIGSRNSVSNSGFAFGLLNVVEGNSAVAIGSGTSAANDSSFAFGANIINNIQNSMMFGVNDSGKLTIRQDGHVGVNTAEPRYALDVNGTLGAKGYPVLPRWTNKTTQITQGNGTTLRNITGLEWTAMANSNYSVDCTLYYDSNITTNGISLTFDDWGGSVSTVRMSATIFTVSTTTVNSATNSGMGTKITSTAVQAANTIYVAKLYATINNGASQVVITPQVSSEVATDRSTININSVCEVSEI